MQDKLDLTYRDEGNPKYIVIGLLLHLVGLAIWTIFFILKVTDIINMSWFWVFFPMWIIPACISAVTIIVSIYILVFKRD